MNNTSSNGCLFRFNTVLLWEIGLDINQSDDDYLRFAHLQHSMKLYILRTLKFDTRLNKHKSSPRKQNRINISMSMFRYIVTAAIQLCCTCRHESVSVVPSRTIIWTDYVFTVRVINYLTVSIVHDESSHWSNDSDIKDDTYPAIIVFYSGSPNYRGPIWWTPIGLYFNKWQI